MLAGAAGHSYGAHGLWQMAQGDGFMAHWGDSQWTAAARAPGASQLGLGAEFLRTLPWWRLTPRPDALRPGWQAGQEWMPLLAGVDEGIFLVYFPAWRGLSCDHVAPPAGRGELRGDMVEPPHGGAVPRSTVPAYPWRRTTALMPRRRGLVAVVAAGRAELMAMKGYS